MKFLFVLVLALFGVNNAHGAKPCAEIVNSKAKVQTSFQAGQLTEIALKELIGAKISYSGKYAYNDPSDNRKIKGAGIITSIAVWGNDTIPTFSIRLLTDSGEQRNVQIAYDDSTFLLKVREDSELIRLLAIAKQDGLLVRIPNFHALAGGDTSFFNETQNQNLRVYYVAGDGTAADPIRVKMALSSKTKVPSDIEMATAYINNMPLEYEFLTPDGPFKIDLLRLLAVAY